MEKPGWELMLEQQDAHLQLNNAAEVVGKVQQDLSIKVFQATDFGSNIGTGHTHFPVQWSESFQMDDGWLIRLCAMQISMPSKQSWMPHIGTRRYSMIVMTELLAVRKELWEWSRAKGNGKRKGRRRGSL